MRFSSVWPSNVPATAGDGFEATLPVVYDIERRATEHLAPLTPGVEVAVPLSDEAARPGSLVRRILVTPNPSVAMLLSSLRFLHRYEYGCTEQQVSKLYPAVLLDNIRADLGLPDWYLPDKDGFASLFTYLEETLTDDGLYSYWPGSRGYVNLTAYVVEFLNEALEAGIQFDEQLIRRPKQALIESLRSDYRGFVSGYAGRERIDAQVALDKIGYFDPGYAQDLLADAFQADLYSRSRIVDLFYRRGLADQDGVKRLLASIWESLVFMLRDGKEIFAGFDYSTNRYGGLVLSSEIRTLSAVFRALYRAEPENPRTALLLEELLLRGDSNGWGSTQANVQALLALYEVFPGIPLKTSTGAKVDIVTEDGSSTISLNESGTISAVLGGEKPTVLKLASGYRGEELYAWIITEYIPDIPGDQIVAENNGFVVSREQLVYDANDRLRSRVDIDADTVITYDLEQIVEEHVRVINSEERNFVAVKVPLASGFEPLNPRLANAPPQATPRGRTTHIPSYTDYADDGVTYYFDTLPSGTFDFYFRVRASFEGRFVQPPAKAEMMYDLSSKGRSNGARIDIQKERR